MIFFYLLVSIMPMMRHPLWTEFIGDFTVIKYLGSASAVYALMYLATKGTIPRFLGSWQARWFILFGFWGMASYLAFGLPQPFEVSPFMNFASFLLLLFVTLTVVDSPNRLRWIFLSAIGSVAFASAHVLREWQNAGMSLGYRPGWVTGDPNYYSVSALLCLPIAFYLLQTRQPPWERWFCLGSLLLTLAALTVAASRGGFLGLAAITILIVWRSGRRRRYIGVAACLFVLALMSITPASPLDRLLRPTQSDVEAADIRTLLWKAGLRMVEQHPLTGIGAGNFKPVVHRFMGDDLKNSRFSQDLSFIAHNTYVEVAAELGIPGFLLFASVITATLLSLGRVRRMAQRAHASFLYRATEGLQAGLLGFIVSAFFVSVQYQKLFWLFVFLSAALPPLLAARMRRAAPRRGLAAPRPVNEPNSSDTSPITPAGTR